MKCRFCVLVEGYELPRSWGGVRAAKVMGNPGVLGTQTKNDIMQTWNIFPIEAARATIVDFTNQLMQTCIHCPL